VTLPAVGAKPQETPVPQTASALALAALAFVIADTAAAQRGGRRRSEAIQQRVGSWFVDVELPAGEPAAGQDPLAAVALVQDARQSNQLTVLYLFDPTANPEKQRMFEQTVFGNDEVGVSLRCFRCGRMDVTKWPAGKDREQAQKRAPVFVVFDEHGKQAGELAMTGYKAAINPLVQLLGKAASGHVKPTLAAFVEQYRDLVRDLEQIEQKRRAIDEAILRLTSKDDKKRADLEQELKALAAEEQKLFEAEKGLVEKAKVVPRDENGVRMGERGGRGR
jgi:hypothetical protein